MKAIIMAGGEGTRLRPLTCTIPKPMVPIVGTPVMEHIINLLKEHDINNIATTLYYRPNIIKDYFGDGSKFNINLSYFTEESPLGTGGSVLNTGEFLNDTVIVISGDAITDINLVDAVKFHKKNKSIATLVLKRQPIPLEYGIVILDDENKIVRFLEKPSWGEVFSDTVNTGIYILEPEAFSHYKKGDVFDFSKDLFPKLLKEKAPMFGYITDSYWSDIGDLKTYMNTNFDALDGKIKLYNKFSGNKSNSQISNEAKIDSPVYIGENCTIKNGAVIKPYSIIGNNCTIEEGSTIKRSILWDMVHIGRNNELRGTIICSKSITKNNVNIYENSIVGDESEISSSALIRPNIKIWPQKYVEEGSIINKNLVWGTKGTKSFFGSKDIKGEINIDITPEFCTLLGSAFVNVVKKSRPVILTCDNNNASNTIKSSIISGITSSGSNVFDCGMALLPMNRYAVRTYNAAGGIHIWTDTDNENTVHIELIDQNGSNISRGIEKKIEQLLIREDFQRCNALECGSIMSIDNYSSQYVLDNMKIIKNLNEIKNINPKILIASPSNNTINITNYFLESLGCNIVNDYSLISKNSEQNINEVKKRVISGSYFMGVIIEENGENLMLIDKSGRLIDKDKYLFLSSIILLRSGIKKLIIPYTATSLIDKYASDYDAKVIRTKSNTSDLMNEILNSNEDSTPLQYILCFDAILAAAKIIDFLIEESISLSNIVDEIPVYYLKKHTLSCSYENMGNIIRQIVEIKKGDNIELFDGIKLNSEKGWVLILPDNEKPVFNIYSEGNTQEFADEISSNITEEISKLMKNIENKN